MQYKQIIAKRKSFSVQRKSDVTGL